MKRLFIFDNDGVLWNSEYIWVGSLFHLLTFYGKSITWEEAFNLFAGTSYGTKKDIVLTEYGVDISLPENRKILEEKEAELLKDAELTNNMKDVFEYLHQNNIDFCIATGAPQLPVLKKVEKWGLSKYFNAENVIASETIEALGMKGKPAPDIFLYAAQKQGYDPKDCIVIEDSKQGIQAGLSAGMRVVGFFEYQNDIKDITFWAVENEVSDIVFNADELLEKIKSV